MENKENLNGTMIKLPTDVYRLRDFLIKNCNGKKNILSYSEIAMMFDTGSHSYFKKNIQKIRECFDLKVCSTSKGYYIPETKEEESNYLVNMTCRHLKTCLAQGIDKRIFYDILNNTYENDTIDGQQKLKVSTYAESETRRYSGTGKSE